MILCYLHSTGNESEIFNGNVLAVKINEVGDSKLPFIAIVAESVPTDGGNWYPQATINS